MRYCGAQNLLQNYYDSFKMSRTLPNNHRQKSSNGTKSHICHEFCHSFDNLTAIDKVSLLLALLHFVSSLKYVKFSSAYPAVQILLTRRTNIKQAVYARNSALLCFS